MVSIRWCHMPYNSSEYGFVARDNSLPLNFSSWRYQLAPKIIRFDTIRLFLRSYANDSVHVDKPLTLEHLKTTLRQVMAEIPPNMCQKLIENYLNISRGGHLTDEVFHIIMSTFKLYNQKEIS